MQRGCDGAGCAMFVVFIVLFLIFAGTMGGVGIAIFFAIIGLIPVVIIFNENSKEKEKQNRDNIERKNCIDIYNKKIEIGEKLYKKNIVDAKIPSDVLLLFVSGCKNFSKYNFEYTLAYCWISQDKLFLYVPVSNIKLYFDLNSFRKIGTTTIEKYTICPVESLSKLNPLELYVESLFRKLTPVNYKLTKDQKDKYSKPNYQGGDHSKLYLDSGYFSSFDIIFFKESFQKLLALICEKYDNFYVDILDTNGIDKISYLYSHKIITRDIFDNIIKVYSSREFSKYKKGSIEYSDMLNRLMRYNAITHEEFVRLQNESADEILNRNASANQLNTALCTTQDNMDVEEYIDSSEDTPEDISSIQDKKDMCVIDNTSTEKTDETESSDNQLTITLTITSDHSDTEEYVDLSEDITEDISIQDTQGTDYNKQVDDNAYAEISNSQAESEISELDIEENYNAENYEEDRADMDEEFDVVSKQMRTGDDDIIPEDNDDFEQGDILLSEESLDEYPESSVADNMQHYFSAFDTFNEYKNWTFLPHIGSLSVLIQYCKFVFQSEIDADTKERIMLHYFFVIRSKPNVIAVGKEEFDGFILYGYLDKNICLLESCNDNNSVYILNNDWTDICPLDKFQIFSSGYLIDRIPYSDNWQNILGRKLNQYFGNIYAIYSNKNGNNKKTPIKKQKIKIDYPQELILAVFESYVSWKSIDAVLEELYTSDLADNVQELTRANIMTIIRDKEGTYKKYVPVDIYERAQHILLYGHE